jgi:hypothetical protein
MTPIRKVVCAAIRADDGDILVGIRHYSTDMHKQIDARHDGDKFKHRHDQDQGFVDQWGVYMTRKEAMVVARDAEQQINFKRNIDKLLLYSEGLY